jgi:hypothetical protein
MTNPSNNKPYDEKPKGLAKKAILDARQLFEETGDVRYLVIALGKRATSHSVETIPNWILEACELYAETVFDTPHKLRPAIKHASILNSSRSSDAGFHYEIFKKASERFYLRENDKRKAKPTIKAFTTVVKEVHYESQGVETTDADLQSYYRLRKETFDTEDHEIKVSWLFEEAFLMRNGPKRSSVNNKKTR